MIQALTLKAVKQFHCLVSIDDIQSDHKCVSVIFVGVSRTAFRLVMASRSFFLGPNGSPSSFISESVISESTCMSIFS
uniref:Uncharacterized protein n=1 Tax=Arion vulgaris TaxID=1028688 RepID=A0A0B7A8R5_9EUPU